MFYIYSHASRTLHRYGCYKELPYVKIAFVTFILITINNKRHYHTGGSRIIFRKDAPFSGRRGAPFSGGRVNHFQREGCTIFRGRGAPFSGGG